MYSLNRIFSSGLGMFPSRILDYLTKPQHQAREAPFRAFSQGCSRDSKNIIDSCCCLSEVEVRSQLLKTPYTSNTESKELELRLTWKSSSLMMNFHGTGRCHASFQGRKANISPTYNKNLRITVKTSRTG